MAFGLEITTKRQGVQQEKHLVKKYHEAAGVWV